MKRLIPILFIVLLILSGCLGNNNPASPTTPGEAKGSLSLTIKSDLTAKTIQPDIEMSIARYQIYGTGPNGKTFNQSISESETTVAIDLVVGQWTINVDAYNNADIKIAEGAANATITAGNNNVAITVRPLTGDGTLKLDLAWTEGVLNNPVVRSSLTSKNGVKNLTFTVADNKAAAYTGTEKAGYHVLIVKLLEDNILKWGMMEAVRIITDQTAYHQYDIEIVEGNVTMTISPDLQNPILVTLNYESDVTLKYGDDITVTATTSQPVGSYQWYLDGDPLDGETNPSITIGSALALGKHRLDLLVIKDEIFSSGSLGINVTRTGVTPTPTSMVTPTPTRRAPFIASVSASYYHSLALKNDGTVWAWGYNGYGQLGNGTYTNSSTPVQVSGLSNVIAVAAAMGGSHSLALKNDGTVWAWGYNCYGQLGNGSATNSNTPIQVSGLSNVIAIAAGDCHCLALKRDGTVWAWGYNGYGQLGNASSGNSYTPIRVNLLTNVTAIAAGYCYSLALISDGTLSSWGYNGYGELGIGSYNSWSIPVQLTGIDHVKAITAGYCHGLALKTDNTLWVWGYNGYGQLGNGTTSISTTPIVVNRLNNILAFAGGGNHTLASLSDGTTWAWGWNNKGQLGIGPNPDIYTPIQVSLISNVILLGAGYYHTLAVKGDGTVWAWGSNEYGQLGDGTTNNKAIPVEISGFTLF